MNNYKIFRMLKQIKDYQGDVDDQGKLMQTIFYNILRDKRSPFSNEVNYKIKASYKQTNIAVIWWCGIFDVPLYYDYFGAKNRENIGASKGYYIVYLFNENKDKLYLTFNQAAKGISRPKNKELLEHIITINDYIRSELKKDRVYYYDIIKLLSEYGKGLSRDYEYGNILALEYDLNGDEITDDVFYNDLKDIKSQFEIFKSIINCNGQIENVFTGEIYDISQKKVFIKTAVNYNEQIQEDESIEYINDTDDADILDEGEAKRRSERKVEYIGSSITRRVKTDPALRKYVLKKYEYKCQYDEQHVTFLKKNNMQYMEIHHLIPLKYQYLFGENFNLDTIDNLIVLCPICHKAIHYGSKSEKDKILKRLYNESQLKNILIEKQMCKNYTEFYKLFYKS